MSYSELSDEEKSLIFSMFDQGWEPKDVSKETNVSYDQIITQRNKWDLKQRGFTSWKDYKNHIADKQGFSTYIEYQRYTSKRLRVKGKVVDLLVELLEEPLFESEVVLEALHPGVGGELGVQAGRVPDLQVGAAIEVEHPQDHDDDEAADDTVEQGAKRMSHGTSDETQHR